MANKEQFSKIDVNGQKIVSNKALNIWEALIPVLFLMFFLGYNIKFAKGELLGEYSNHFILLISGFVATIVGLFNKVSLKRMLSEVFENLQSVFVPILILFLVGALAGTWKVSGVIPAMVYYGLQIINPEIFLPLSVIIAIIVSLATGSSWTTSATVGIALIGIGSAFGISPGMIAGAVISGAYFGDKMSPLSDTTNLAPAMAGTDLYAHIRYMAITTIPTIIITLIFFGFVSMNIVIKPIGETNQISQLMSTLKETFYITPYLFIVPFTVVGLILLKTKPLIALTVGVLIAVIFAFVFQGSLLNSMSSSSVKSIFNAIFIDTELPTDNPKLKRLYNAGGMKGMLWTIYLIISAMVFGGIMDAIGALARITKVLLSFATSIFGLFASTVASCLGLNVIASDQYLAIVIPGKMFKKAYEDKGLSPENLSRTLEDSGTVTSVLIPWNTCGAYQSGVLGVGVTEYFAFAIFNWLSPFMTLFFAAFSIKIKQLKKS
ncbi:MAG: Na+/H+ antiporter NhaC [Flavobacteriaceae bacterium]|nr:Na+/H+ antiporter NhaC [Flavobacteriaceae bacterium]